ncbi:MAG TPA: hypothetical protein VK509_19975 [Polyangiales bacterium]|nr:hypothetical protein [Polyangiales bacterium]
MADSHRGARAALGLGGCLLCFALSGCGSDRERSTPAPSAPAQSALRPPAAAEAVDLKPLPPPNVAFVAPQPWQSQNKQPVTTVAPPDLAAETWRALVTQNHPLQAPTPRWQALPAADNIELAMQPGVRFRCLVTAVEVVPEADDFNRKLKAWALTRRLRCSGDGWRSWTEYPHHVRLLQDGTRETTSVAEALLREHDDSPAANGTRETELLVRDDKEQRAASVGPPRILPGVKVDD